MVASAGVVASCLHYYYGSLLRNVRVDRPIVIHAHAVVFTGWLVPNPPARRVVAFFLWSAPDVERLTVVGSVTGTQARSR